MTDSVAMAMLFSLDRTYVLKVIDVSPGGGTQVY